MASAAAIVPDLIPPIDVTTGESARATGETFNSHIVYETHVLDREKTYAPENRRKVIDQRTGEQVTRKGRDGHYPIFKFPMRFTKREFILERSPQGEVRMNFDFRPSEQEVRAREQAKLTGEFGRRLAAEAVRRGVTPEELVASLMDQVTGGGDEDADAPQAPAGPGEPTLVKVSPGWWNVQVDGENMSEQNLRKPEAEQLATSLANAVGAPSEPQSY